MLYKVGQNQERFMSTQAIGFQPPKLNHYLTEVPETIAIDAGKKAFAANVIAKITYVAIVAICATVLAVSLFATVSGALPLVLLGLALTTPLLAMGAAKLQALSNNHSNRALREKGVADELKLIKDWKTAEIKDFYSHHNITLEHLPIEELEKLKPNEPLTALLPLIARYKYLEKQGQEAKERYSINLAFQSDVSQLRIDAGKSAFFKMEEEAIPHTLDASVILLNLAKPTLDLKRDDLGTVKDIQERIFDRLLRKNDDYFIFHDPNKRPLKLSEIENLTPKELGPLLSPALVMV